MLETRTLYSVLRRALVHLKNWLLNRYLDHSFRNPVIQQEFTRYFSDRRSHYECIEVKGLIKTSSYIGYAYLKLKA
jgi:hypothetical protein